MTKKQLAKVNKKMTNYLTKGPCTNPVYAEEDTEELELNIDEVDERKLERLQQVGQEKKAWANTRMITELLRHMVEEVPARVEIKEIMDYVMEAAWSRIEKRLEAKETVAMLMETVMNQSWWKYQVEDVWKTIVKDNRLKRVIVWKLDNQNLESQLLVKSKEKEERLLRRTMTMQPLVL